MTDAESTSTRPMRVAVVGAGPSGLYVADSLTFEAAQHIDVDVIERLPVPFGLLRYGVAPDHPAIKSATSAFQEVLDRPEVNLYCNIEVGRDVNVADLRNTYDAVVYATGADSDNRMDIPGEDLPGSHSATSFVKWYNGHPESAVHELENARSVAVVGAGNVALDVTRMLVKNPQLLAATDIPHDTLAAFAASTVTDVHIIARRGAEHAKFTTRELKELAALDDVDIVVRSHELPDESVVPKNALVKRNLQFFRAHAAAPTIGSRRRIHFHFRSVPIEIVGNDVVEGIMIERGADQDSKILPVQIVFRAIGYRSRPIDGIPFDDETVTIACDDHRVIRDGVVQRGEYAVGWAKRGATGILGTNRADAADTVATILYDAAELTSKPPTAGIVGLLRERGHRVLDKRSWQTITDAEHALGTSLGREIVKIRSWDELIEAGLAEHVSLM
ncbi:MAG: NADP oxidoreductase [Gordonia sp.]|nr:NADP oxidoreductase [Gordonia sp. (in: high G+C Gram-positive bacteria)]